MPEYLSPGVYVEEFEMGPRPMEGVSTSTAGFIGLAERGATEGIPELVTNVADFFRKFGGYLSENEFGDYRYLAYAVDQFFSNGGSRCYVMRVAPSDAMQAGSSKDEKELLKFVAKNAGNWGNKIRVILTPSSKAKTQIYEDLGGNKYKVKNSVGFNTGDIVEFTDGETTSVNKVVSSMDNIIEFESAFDGDVIDKNLIATKVITTSEVNVIVKYEDLKEEYSNVSLNISSGNFIEKKLAKSDLVSAIVTLPEELAVETTFKTIAKSDDAEFVIELKDGSNGAVASMSAADYIGVDKGPGKRTGIQSFIDNDEVSIMAVPGITDPNVQMALIAHCENLTSRFAVLDIPRENKKVSDVQTHRNMYDSDYAAMYHPWVQVFDPLDKRNIFVPPSGTVLGIYSRSDQTRGVHKAPANEVLRNCVGLDCQYNKGEQDILNPKGVNLIRSFTGQGLRVWGARTISSNSLWKYVNVRRLFIFLEESIRRNTNWVVFEPNDEELWTRVKRTIEVFLTGVWRSGALMGTTPQEAFFVDIGRTTMSADDINNGRLICVIGAAPVKPAEFVIFRIAQKTATE